MIGLRVLNYWLYMKVLMLMLQMTYGKPLHMVLLAICIAWNINKTTKITKYKLFWAPVSHTKIAFGEMYSLIICLLVNVLFM